MITKLTLRNLRANTARFVMTTFGVVLAVSFVVSAFVLGDGLRQTFDSLSSEIVAGTDLEVRPVDEFGSTESLSDADVAAVLAVDGVADAVGFVEAPENSVRPIKADGTEIPTQGPPQLAFSWVDTPALSPFTLVEGSSPETNEFLVDIGSADRHEFEVGETYTVVTATGRHELTLSGLTRFGSNNDTLGATLMAMNPRQSDALFGTTGYDSIAVALTDAARSNLVAAQQDLAAAVPQLEVVTQATLADETSADFNTQINIIQNVLLGFAGVSLLVSVFIIGNTFAIVLQQRTREMGLLRLVGADESQLRRSAMGEAGVIGLLASAIGIPGGIGVAAGLSALFGAIGAELPDYDIIVSTRTLLVSLVVGVGVTLLAAWWPTRAATRLTPMAALGGGSAASTTNGRGRLITAGALAAAGVAASALGLQAGASTAATVTLMVVASISLFGAMIAISPRLVAPVASAFGVVLERFGMPGRLAVRNSRRQASRTATTAAALMIGLAVVSMALVVGESIKAELRSTLDTAVAADYMLTDQASEAGFPSAVVDELAADPAFGAVTGFRYADMQVGEEIIEVTAASFADLPSLVELGVTNGGFGAVVDSVLISDERADADSLVVGSPIEVMLDSGVTTTLTVSGVFTDDSIVPQDFLVDVAVFDATGVTASELWVLFDAAAGASTEQVAAAIEQVETLFPQGELETAAEFRDRMEGLVDQILSVLNALVALAIVIALIGIANTLALSVSERTREIGLVRAVGMSRRGVRRMIRYESAVIATFGAVLGVVIGLGLGWLMVQALPATVTSTLAVPGTRIVTLVVVAMIAGVLAALLPARRAGKMNVLAAIAS